MSEREAPIFVAANELDNGKLALPMKKQNLTHLLTYIADVIDYETTANPEHICQLYTLYDQLKVTPDIPGLWAIIELDQHQLGILNSAINVSTSFINRYGTFEFKTSVLTRFKLQLKCEVRELYLEYYRHSWGKGPILITHLEENHDLLYQFFFIVSNHKNHGGVEPVARWVKDFLGAHSGQPSRWFKRQWYKRIAMPGVVMGNIKQRESGTHCSIYVQTLLQTINGLIACDQFDREIYQLAIQSGYNTLKNRAKHWNKQTIDICEVLDKPETQCPTTS